MLITLMLQSIIYYKNTHHDNSTLNSSLNDLALIEKLVVNSQYHCNQLHLLRIHIIILNYYPPAIHSVLARRITIYAISSRLNWKGMCKYIHAWLICSLLGLVKYGSWMGERRS